MIGQKPPSILLSLSLAVLFGLIGIVFPLAFVLTAIILWGIVDHIRNPVTRSDNVLNHAYDATAQDADWKQRYFALCESPAESAFLTQMIAAFHLAPSKGLLVGDGIKVELQAEKLKYRLDFLVNIHHGIEVDGAEYHSDAYDRSKDAFRDAELSRHGIKILRLPAKLVLNDTNEVIRRVREYLRDPTPAAAMPLPPRPMTQGEYLMGARKKDPAPVVAQTPSARPKTQGEYLMGARKKDPAPVVAPTPSARPKTQGEQLMGARKKDPVPIVAPTLVEIYRAGVENRRRSLQVHDVDRERMERIEKDREEQQREEQRRGRLVKQSDGNSPFDDLPL